MYEKWKGSVYPHRLSPAWNWYKMVWSCVEPLWKECWKGYIWVTDLNRTNPRNECPFRNKVGKHLTRSESNLALRRIIPNEYTLNSGNNIQACNIIIYKYYKHKWQPFVSQVQRLSTRRTPRSRYIKVS